MILAEHPLILARNAEVHRRLLPPLLLIFHRCFLSYVEMMRLVDRCGHGHFAGRDMMQQL